MPATSLEIEGLSAGYGPTRILEDISFSVPAGKRLAVLGRNGMGKTTLLATLAGQTRRYGGQIRLGGADIAAAPSAARARKGLGYVPQMRCIFPTLTVEENLFVGLKGQPRSVVEEAYRMFPRLKERRRHFGNQLSGGEQQMLSTARTVLGRPSVLLLDEPLEDVFRREVGLDGGARGKSVLRNPVFPDRVHGGEVGDHVLQPDLREEDLRLVGSSLGEQFIDAGQYLGRLAGNVLRAVGSNLTGDIGDVLVDEHVAEALAVRCKSLDGHGYSFRA